MNKWHTVHPDRLEQWIPDEWRVHRECILLWNVKTSRWNPDTTVFDARAILVYRERSDGRWDALGIATHPAQLSELSVERARLLPREWPAWNYAWTMPVSFTGAWTPPPALFSEEATMDDFFLAIDSVWRGRRDARQLASNVIQHVLCMCTDALGDIEFESKRIALEHEWFHQCLIRPLLCKHGEQGLFDFIALLGLPVVPLETIASDDLKGYIARHGPDVPRPTRFICVPMEMVAENHHFDICAGGVVHVAHLDLPHWMWEHLLEKRRALARGHCLNTRPVPDQVRYIAQEVLVRRPKRRLYSSNGAPQSGIGDMEDLMASAAPCMRGVLSTKQFPKNRTRNTLVRAMNTARIDHDVIRDTLVTIHRRELPSATAEDTKRRFNYEYELKKGYAPTKCGALAHLCPYEGSDDQRARQCHEAFLEAHPQVPVKQSDYSNFGPHKYWLFHSRRILH